MGGRRSNPVDSAHSSGRRRRVGIIQTRGIGDIIIALPIADWFVQQGCEVLWPIDGASVHAFRLVKPQIKFLDVGCNARDRGYFFDAPLQLLRNAGCNSIICLYSYLSDQKVYNEHLSRFLKFDEYKYAIAGVPFEKKWQLQLNRDSDREQALFQKLQITRPYVCVHTETWERPYSLRLPEEWARQYQIINVRRLTDSPFDWIYTFEHAHKLLFIESCFSNLVDQLNLPNEKDVVLHAPVPFTPVLKNEWKIGWIS
jgi:hypothetical protein